MAPSLAVVLAVAVVAFVRVDGKPVAGVGPSGVYRRGCAGADRHCVAGAVFNARGGVCVFVRRCDKRRARRARPTMSEFFGRDGVGIGPEAATGGAGFRFGGGIDRIGVEALVMPGIAVVQHLEIDVGRTKPHRAENASVLVL